MRKQKKSFELIVSDGNSTDGTLKLLEKLGLKYRELKILISPKKGCSFQLINGFCESKGEIIIYMDGDGQYLAEDILKFINTPPLTIASATKKINKTPIFRKILSKSFSLFVNIVTGIEIPDFTSGLKKIPRDFVDNFKLEWGYYFLISTELIIKGKENGYKIITIPVQCEKREYGRSKLISYMGLKFLLSDFLALIKYKIKHFK